MRICWHLRNQNKHLNFTLKSPFDEHPSNISSGSPFSDSPFWGRRVQFLLPGQIHNKHTQHTTHTHINTKQTTHRNLTRKHTNFSSLVRAAAPTGAHSPAPAVDRRTRHDMICNEYMYICVYIYIYTWYDLTRYELVTHDITWHHTTRHDMI